MNDDEECCFTLWQKHYLQLEVKKLETTLNHYRSADWISNENYKFLRANLKMIQAFLNTRSHISRQTAPCVSCNHKPPYSRKRQHYSKQRSPIQPSLFDVPKPVSTTPKIEVVGLKEGLEALKPRQETKQSGPKFPYKIPAGTHWRQIIIKFLNNELIEIYVKKQKHVATYSDMGMKGKGNIPEPSEQWLFLKVLAMCHGELTIKDPDAKEKYKKQKQVLSETLKNYFSIDYDPFYPYQYTPEKPGNSYKIKLTLIPPPEATTSVSPNVDTNEPDDSLGIQEFFNTQTPQVIE